MFLFWMKFFQFLLIFCLISFFMLQNSFLIMLLNLELLFLFFLNLILLIGLIFNLSTSLCLCLCFLIIGGLDIALNLLLLI